MEPDFEVVYESEAGVPVRLEVAPRVDAAGVPYQHHRLIVAEGVPGAVVIATAGTKVLLAKSNREAAGRTLWEFPRGFGEVTDADPVTTGVRELAEETGLQAVSASLIGMYVIDSSIYPQQVAVVTCPTDPGVTGPPDGEVEETKWFTIPEVEQMIANGTLSDAHSLSAWAVWQATK